MINGIDICGYDDKHHLEISDGSLRNFLSLGGCSVKYDISDSYFSKLASDLDLYRATDTQIANLNLSEGHTDYLVALRAVLKLGTWKYDGNFSGNCLEWESLDDVCEAFKVAVRAVDNYYR